MSLVAFDGGAFQQGIAAGIFNVAQGFLNAAAKLDPSFEFVLVADPRLGPVKPELVERLTVRPGVLLGEIGPTYGPRPNGLVTRDPDIHFVVDGMVARPYRIGGRFVYSGPAPRRSFVIASRSARPYEVGKGSDRRLLGFCFTKILVESDTGQTRDFPYDSKLLEEGFHSPESGYRWTTGRAVLPVSLFPPGATIRLAIDILDTLAYRLGNGAFDRAFDRSARALAACANRLATRELTEQLRRRGIDIYFANHFLPAVLPGMKSVAWAHDIIPLLYPHFFMPDAIANFQHVVEVFRHADHIFCNSEKTREDLLTRLHIDPGRATVTGIDIADDIRAAEPAVKRAVLCKFDLPDEFILCVGTLEPRKNHLRLVKAYHRILEADGEVPQLVLVGKPGWGYTELVDQIGRLGLKDRVVLLSDVSVDELAALYSAALFVAYPSLYEGFGLPVLEAMACGTAVLTSRRSSMSEIAGDAALLVDPYDETSIADGLLRLIHDAPLRAELGGRGPERRTEYSWEKTAGRILDILRGL